MSGAIDQTLQLALDLYAAPLQYRELLDQGFEIPADFPEFLRLVARDDDSPEITAHARQAAVSPALLKQACYFYIRQVLFHDAHDYYRVLGVPAGASAEAIRLNYHLLIRLFHPDRNPEGESWNELFAPLLNEAYNTLKRAGNRRRYDRARATGTPPRGARQVAPRRRLRRGPYSPPEVAPGVAELLYRIPLWQTRPKLLIWGLLIFLLGLFLVILILNARPPLDSGRNPGVNQGSGQQVPPRVDSLAQVTRDEPAGELPHYLRGSKSKTPPQAVAQDEPASIPEHSLLRLVETDRRAAVGADTRVAKRDVPNAALSPASAARTPAATGPQTTKPSERATGESPHHLGAPNSNTPPQGAAQGEPASIPENSLLRLAERDRRAAVGADTRVAKRDVPNAAPSPASAAGATVAAGPQTAKPSQQEPTSAKSPNVPRTDSLHVRNMPFGNTVAAHTALKMPEKPVKADQPAPSPLEPCPFDLEPSTLPLAPCPSLKQAELTLAAYLAAYETGDLSRLLPLFLKRVETNDGIGIDIIERDYGNLFRKTLRRRMLVQRAVWNREPGGVRLSSEVEIRVLIDRREGWLRFAGTMEFYFTHGEDRLRIAKLVHQLKQTDQ